MSPGMAVYGCPVSLIVCIINPEVGVCTLGQLDEIQMTPLSIYGMQVDLRHWTFQWERSQLSVNSQKGQIHCTEINSPNNEMKPLTSLFIFWWLLTSSRVRETAVSLSYSNVWSWGRDFGDAKDLQVSCWRGDPGPILSEPPTRSWRSSLLDFQVIQYFAWGWN